MKKRKILNELEEDIELDNGEIINETDKNITYYDYKSENTITFQFEEACTDKYVKSLIHIGESAKNRGLTPNFIINVLKKAFGDLYYDAICTLSGIIIPSNEKEFNEMLQASFRTSDIATEWYDYFEENNIVGKMYYTHQIVFINEAAISDLSKELSDDGISSETDEYETGMIMTLLHEMRHLMLDTNILLSEEIIPLTENSEEAVENFSRQQYEKLGELKHFK